MSNSLPIDFLARLERIFPKNYDQIISTFNNKRLPTFRINTLKNSRESVLETLTVQGFTCEQVSWYRDAFILTSKTQRELTETDTYKEGHIYLQNLSSMIPVLLLNPQENETILDACAAPGSKTTQIAAAMQNSGQIIANDMSRVRLYKLLANIKTLGVTTITTTHFRAQELWRKFPNTFDRVLVDVPCSLEGRFLADNPKTYKDWSVKKVKKLAEYQKQILHSSISTAKSGATIIYSTCTISPEENEGVVDWVLKKHGHLVELVEASLNSAIEIAPPVLEWDGKEYGERMHLTKRVAPSQTMEAFFVAQFLKK